MNSELPLPCALDIEEEILGLLLKDCGDESLEIIDKASGDDFYSRSNRIIFNEIKSLYGQGRAFDAISVTDSLKDKLKLDEVGGAYQISKIACRCAIGFTHLNGLETLKEKNRLRKLIELSKDIESAGYVSQQSSLEIIEDAEHRMNNISCEISQENLLESGADRVKEMVYARLRGEKVYGIETGIKSFDDVFFGLQRSQYYVIAGRPSAGKTAFIDQIACKLIEQEIPALYVPLESSEDRVIGKIACKISKISYGRFIKNKCNESELKSILKSNEKVRSSKLIFKRPAKLNADSLRSLLVREIRKNDCQVFFIDYLQKIAGEEDPRIGVMNASMRVQDVCVETKAIGVVLAQMNRDAEKEKRPRMGHLKESGQIEQDADNICLLWGEKENHELEYGEMKPVILTIEKNKDGIQGVDQRMFFDRELMTFKERERI